MIIVLSLLIWFYSALLGLYPRGFQNEFAEEMQTVFRESVYETAKEGILPLAILSLKEFGGLPFNVLKEFWHEFQGKELVMVHEDISNAPATTGQVVMGALPFFLFSLILIMFELPSMLFDQAWFITVGGIVFGLLLILPAIGFGIGWAQDFPRWSYQYVGMALLMALYIQNASTPGLKILGIPIFGRELWGWRAWAPIGIAFIITLAISRSFKPFKSFFTNLWNDWSIPSYFMISAVPLLLMFTFDEIDRIYTLYFVIPFGILMMGMVIFYLQGRNTWQRVLALTVGVIAIIFPAVWGSTSYWHPRDGIYSFASVQEMVTKATTVTVVMLLPGWLELIRRIAGRLRTT
jgi:hypothetical protein